VSLVTTLEPSLVVETRLFPTATIDLTGRTPLSAGGIAAGVVAGLVLKLVQPKVTVELQGTTVATWAPAGAPAMPNSWKVTRIVLLVAAGLVAFRLARLIL
jgi:hypothetical protein